MAAGKYEQISPYDVESFRHGILPTVYLQESASLNVAAGSPVIYNAARQLVGRVRTVRARRRHRGAQCYRATWAHRPRANP